MKKLNNIKALLKKIPKGAIIFGLIFVFAIVSIGVPTLARFEHRNPLNFDTTWDGSIATGYRSGSGTYSDPFIISDGSELAYFASQLKTTNYEGVYFKLGSNIILNRGIFAYDETNGLTYTEEITQYIKKYTDEVYTNPSYGNLSSTTIHLFPSLDNFAGTFDGNSYTIYGAYITNEEADEVGLFTNLTGNIENLYVANALIVGGTTTGGLASTMTGSTIESVSFDGTVISKEENVSQTKDIEVTVSPLTILETETNASLHIDLKYPENDLLGNITNVTLTGTLEKTNESSIVTIGSEEIPSGEFELTLTPSLNNSLDILLTGSASDNVTFSNVVLHVTADNQLTGGIAGTADASTLKNVINKADVYGNLYAGGLFGGATNQISISDVYNLGKVASPHIAAGFIGLIENNPRDVQILRSYNAGEISGSMSGGLLGEVNNNTRTVSLNSVFDTSTAEYKIYQNVNTTLNITGCYTINGTAIYEGTVNGSFRTTSKENLQSSSYLTAFWPFVDIDTLRTSPNRVWVFESGELPILYIDDTKNPIAEIHAGTYTWNNVGYVLDEIYFDKSAAFSINEISAVRPVSQIEYKIVATKEALMQDEIEEISDWTSYTEGEVISLNEEGFYIVYAKITDSDGQVSYLNTDLLILDYSAPEATLTLETTTWNTLKTDLEPYFINEPTSISLTANDAYSGIKSISYYVTDNELALDELEALEETSWLPYQDAITISNEGKNVVYARVIDNTNHVTYINTSYLYYTGYNETTIGSGYTNSDGEMIAVSSNSMIHTRFTYQDEFSYFEGSTHQLRVNNLLPANTKITIIDNLKEKVYRYTVNDTEDFGYNSCNDENCYMTIPFTVFKEIGMSSEKYFNESLYTGPVEEDFTVLIDFKNTENSISSLQIELLLQSSDETKTRKTLPTTLKTAMIHSLANGSVNFTTNEVSPIYYNSDSVTNITLNPTIFYQMNGNTTIWDSTLNNQTTGVEIWITNESGEKISRASWQNMSFQIGSTYYYPEENSTLYLPINGEEILTMTTYEGNSLLPVGNYTIHFKGYATYQKYASLYSNTEKTVPLIVTELPMTFDYGLQVKMNDEQRILSKTNPNPTISFDCLYTGALQNPNIRISLYQKETLTAYNQDYELINLQNYATSTLDSAGSNSYYVTRSAIAYDGTENTINSYDVNLDVTKMTSGGYEFVFELFDGETKIGQISKKIIVR